MNKQKKVIRNPDKKIKIIQLISDSTVLGLRENDYFAIYDMNFYSGAGIYGIRNGDEIKFAKCIELLNGKIQIKESSNISVLTPQNFRKVVHSKVFAKIALEGNVSTIAIAELKSLLMTRR